MEWISVEDRLPSFEKEVLVAQPWAEGNESGYFYYLATLGDDGKWYESISCWVEDPDDLIISKITHWALPNPPITKE